MIGDVINVILGWIRNNIWRIVAILLVFGLFGFLMYQAGYYAGLTYLSSLHEEEPDIIDTVKLGQDTFEPEPEPVVVTAPVIAEETPTMSKEDINLIALVTMAEAEGESELGKRLVIDTILNRVDHDRFPDTVYDVVYQPSQFSSMWNGRVDRCEVRDDICRLVTEELANRTNSECVYFRMGHYHSWGTPLFQEGCHYFSSY